MNCDLDRAGGGTSMCKGPGAARWCIQGQGECGYKEVISRA